MALITSGFGPAFGGIGVVSAAIARAMARDVEVVVWRHHPNWPRFLRTTALIARALPALLSPPDLILFSHIDLARLMVVLPFPKKTRYAVMMYGIEVWRPLDRLRQAAVRRAAALVSISELTVRKAREANPWLPTARVLWLGTTEREGSEHAAEPTVLMLGRMASQERYKGHDTLLDAWPRILEAVPEAKLVIVGDGDDRARLEARAAGSPSVTFTGFVPDEQRELLLRSASALVSVSTGEGFCLAALEAASAGLPVVALKGTVSEELFPDGNGHVFLESADPQHVADAVIGLLTDRRRATALGAAGRRRFREMFTQERFYERIRSTLQPLLSDPTSATT